MIKDSNGQYTLDFVISMGIFLLAITTSFYYMISAFTPHYERFDIYASAYRISTILSEDAGLNLTNISCNVSTCEASLGTDWEGGTINSSVEDWYDAINYTYEINTTIKRVGLADTYRILKFKSSYERCIPNVLNATKVEMFFNESWWSNENRFYNQSGEELWRNISILIGLNSTSHFNVSIRWLNGTIYDIDGTRCQIGYPIPEVGEVAKFERFVVIDREVYTCLDSGMDDECINSTSLKRLVVYVW